MGEEGDVQRVVDDMLRVLWSLKHGFVPHLFPERCYEDDVRKYGVLVVIPTSPRIVVYITPSGEINYIGRRFVNPSSDRPKPEPGVYCDPVEITRNVMYTVSHSSRIEPFITTIMGTVLSILKDTSLDPVENKVEEKLKHLRDLIVNQCYKRR